MSQDEIGSIEPGKRADLVALDANPIEDPLTLGRVVMVISRGKVVFDRRANEETLSSRADVYLTPKARRAW